MTSAHTDLRLGEGVTEQNGYISDLARTPPHTDLHLCGAEALITRIFVTKKNTPLVPPVQLENEGGPCSAAAALHWALIRGIVSR